MDGDRTGTMMTSDSGFEAGIRVRVSDDVQDAGRCGSIVGNEVFIGQWWVPVLWDDAEDPDFHKSGCMELLGQPTAADWQEVLYTLTKEMQGVREDDPTAPARRDHIMGIVGRIGSGATDHLDDGDLEEIRRSLMRDAKIGGSRRVRLRTILGKMTGGPDGPRPVWQAISREELLARLYAAAPQAVGRLCDEELDRSGGLLGRVRDLAIKHNEQKVVTS